MITSSIVLFKTDISEISGLLNCLIDSAVDRIYLVDNSPDDKLKILRCKSEKIEYIFGHGNIGYGVAHNISIKKSIEYKCKYHIVINPDIYFEKGTIERLIEFMDANNDVAQVMPKVVYPNGEVQYLCKLLPTPFDLIGRRFFSKFKYVKNRNNLFELKKSGYDKIMNVPYLSGCFMFLRVRDIIEIGMFDENIFMYGEDIDYSRRMNERFKTIFYPYVEIVHAHKKESYKSYKMLFVHIKSIIYYFNKWGWFFDKERKSVNRKTLEQF